jgi:hypothetical protein
MLYFLDIRVTEYFVCSSDIQSGLLIKATERAVDQFGAMVDFARAMQETKCQHLLGFVKQTVTYWYKLLQEKLCRFGNVFHFQVAL